MISTKIFKIDNQNIDKVKIREAAGLLKNGGLVAFPTETVYGLGGNALSETVVAKIFAAKGRPSDNPLIVHIYSFEQLALLTNDIPNAAKELANIFWPGPLTMIFKAKKNLPENVTGGLGTVGVRMPADPVALELLREADLPIAAPSANISGRPSPTQGQHVIEDLSGKIEGIITSSDSIIGIESTVLDMTTEPSLILRPGSITLEDINKYVAAKYYKIINSEQPKSPGIKYKHYAPKADLYIIKGTFQEKLEKFKNLMSTNNQKKIGMLITQEMDSKLEKKDPKKNFIKIIGSVKNSSEISANLYKSLRNFDTENVDIIYVEDIPEEISGNAYQNRTEKASGGKFI